MPKAVHEAVTGHLALERDIGGYEAEEQVQPVLTHFYNAFATLLNVNPEEIAYVENATRAWDMAFYSLPLREGDRVLTHESEYASNYLAYLQLAQRRGIEIDVVPSDASGQMDVNALRRKITVNTRLIALTHVPTQGGLVNPAVEVGQVAREHGLLYLLDACQSVGQLPVDVREIGCHLLSGTGRKFLRGPRGTGFLYVSNEILGQLDPPFIDLHSATWTGADQFEYRPGAKRFENWESYVAGRVGLARAVDYALEIGVDAIEKRNSHLAAGLRTELARIPGVAIHDQGERKCAIVTFRKDGESAPDLVKRLRQQNVNLSTSSVFSAQLDFARRGLDNLARASVHYFNTETEIERFCKLVRGA
jgi:selenocysteine lyase/cysteine desulfurase